jgi:ribonuclease-3
VRGEAHEQQFEVDCLIPELGIRTSGSGPSRRSAEQSAARMAYDQAIANGEQP